MGIKIPPKLYKFRAWDDIGKMWFKDKTFFISNPSKFNDPFDCCITPRFDKLSEDERIEWGAKLIMEEEGLNYETAKKEL